MYQVKSSPMMRRIASTSAKTGELQRLKVEYERIKEFNDRTIEMKMRQVRLKRLFKEIEDMKDQKGLTRRRSHFPNAEKEKTEEEMRLELMRKARELGKEYSKLNAIRSFDCMLPADAASGLLPAPGESLRRKRKESKALAARRVEYGNEISRHNMARIAMAAKTRNSGGRDTGIEKLKMLKERLNYGNTISNNNKRSTVKKRSKRHLKLKNEAKTAKNMQCVESLPDDTEDKAASDDMHERFELYARETSSFVSATTQHHALDRTIVGFFQGYVPSPPATSEEQPMLNEPQSAAAERAQQSWRFLAQAVRNGAHRNPRRTTSTLPSRYNVADFDVASCSCKSAAAVVVKSREYDFLPFKQLQEHSFSQGSVFLPPLPPLPTPPPPQLPPTTPQQQQQTNSTHSEEEFSAHTCLSHMETVGQTEASEENLQIVAAQEYAKKYEPRVRKMAHEATVQEICRLFESHADLNDKLCST